MWAVMAEVLQLWLWPGMARDVDEGGSWWAWTGAGRVKVEG